MHAEPEISRKGLLTAIIPSHKMVSRVEIKEVTMGPKQKAPLHFHPCPVVGVVTEGVITYQIEGDEIRHLGAGDAFYEPAKIRVACFNNDGDEPAKFVAFYLLDKDENEIIRIIPG